MTKVLLVALMSMMSIYATAKSYGDAINGITVTYNRGENITITGHGDLSLILGDNESYSFTNFGASCIKANGSNVAENDVWTSGTTYTYNDEEYTFNQLCGLSGWGTYALVQTKGSVDIWHQVIKNLYKYNYTVVFASDDNATATINNKVTHSLMDVESIRTLDLSGVYMEKIVSPFYNEGVTDEYQKYIYNNKGTFCKESQYNAVSNTSIETLYTPTVKDGGVLYNGTFNCLPNLRYLHISEGVETLEYKSVEGAAINGTYQLSVLTFPNTLKYIKKNACAGHFKQNGGKLYDLDGNEIPFLQTIVFPASLLEIETNAFGMTCPKDVYFLGVEAPKVARFAWGDEAYFSNNSLSLTSAAVGEGDEKVNIYLSEGYASRENYKTSNGYMCMLHYPAACTKAQAAKYTDPTRNYKHIDWNYEEMLAEADGDRYVNYTPGKETTDLEGMGGQSKLVAPKTFCQEYNPAMVWDATLGTNVPVYLTDEDGNYILDENGNKQYDFSNYNEDGKDYSKGFFGGDYSGAYYDYNLGAQYTWPSMGMAQRATIVAQYGLTWDGVTTIGDAIRNVGGTDYVGDGSEYEGLHQFVFTTGDAGFTTTTTWNLDKFNDGKWHTICVPFNMTKAQMKEVFGKYDEDIDGNPVYDIKLCKFNEVARNQNRVTIKFNDERFDRADDDDVVLEAHVSYLIWADRDRTFTTSAVFKNFEVEPGDPIVTKVTSVGDAESLEYRFVGNYKVNAPEGTTNTSDNTVAVPEYTYYFSFKKQGFNFMTGNLTSTWTPYCSVVLMPEGYKENKAYFSSSSNAKVITKIADETDDFTSIDEVTIEANNNEIIYTNSDVYDVNGVKVGNSIEGLKKGVYVVNGKKYLVK